MSNNLFIRVFLRTLFTAIIALGFISVNAVPHRGLSNPGVQCYWNSSMQIFSHLPRITGNINALEGAHRGDLLIPTISASHSLFDHLNRPGRVDPFNASGKFGIIAGNCMPFGTNLGLQQDAGEFVGHIINKIIQEGHAVEPLFTARALGVNLSLVSRATCDAGHHVSDTQEDCSMLQLPMQLEAATVTRPLGYYLDGFFGPERMIGDTAFNCERCGGRGLATKQYFCRKLPNLLVLSLKRTAHGIYALLTLVPPARAVRGVATVMTRVTVPFVDLDMSPHWDTTPRPGNPLRLPVPAPQVRYDLVGVIMHDGQISYHRDEYGHPAWVNAGHYWSYVRDLTIPAQNIDAPGSWIKYDDASVHPMTARDAWSEINLGQNSHGDRLAHNGKICTIFYQKRLLAGPLVVPAPGNPDPAVAPPLPLLPPPLPPLPPTTATAHENIAPEGDGSDSDISTEDDGEEGDSEEEDGDDELAQAIALSLGQTPGGIPKKRACKG